jgi:hypothetical protein
MLKDGLMVHMVDIPTLKDKAVQQEAYKPTQKAGVQMPMVMNPIQKVSRRGLFLIWLTLKETRQVVVESLLTLKDKLL